MKKFGYFLFALWGIAPLISKDEGASSAIMSQQGLFYSQYQQDQFVYKCFFRDKRDGIFVDIGAHDGVKFSNSKFFEESLNWRGVCIEPVAEIFEQLQKNRSAICIQGCIAAQAGMAPFIRFSGGHYGEMFSGLQATYSQHSLEQLSQGQPYEIIMIPCYTLNEVLLKHGIFHVDYLSIDTEGSELQILNSIDFEQFDIHVIGVENNYEDRRVRDFLISKGYRYVSRIGVDDFFKKVKLKKRKK